MILANFFFIVTLFQASESRVLSSLQNEKQGAEYWVVCPEKYLEAIKPLAEHRAEEGLRVAILPQELFQRDSSNKNSLSEKLQTFFREGYQSWKQRPRFLLLVGQANEDSIPAFHRDWSKENLDPRGESDSRHYVDVASDLPYSQMDSDFLPDLAVGRIPARNAEELKAIVAKIIRYEKSAPGLWRRKLLFLAGLFGEPKIDGAIQSIVTGLIDQEIPYDFDFRVLQSSEDSPYGVGFENEKEFFVQQLSNGCLMAIYAGHGNPGEYACPLSPGAKFSKPNRGWINLFTAQEASQLSIPRGAPILLSFACFTGGFAGKKQSIADAAIRNPQGAVAYIGASGVSNPVSDMLLAHEITKIFSTEKNLRLGELLQKAKRGIVESEDDFHKRISAGAGLFGFDAEMQKRLSDFEMWIYNLHGDPALRIQRPQSSIKLEVTQNPLNVYGEVEGLSDGDVLITLELPRSQLVSLPQKKEKANFEAAWEGANNKALLRAGTELNAGKFESDLALKEPLKPGRYYVKVYVRNENRDAAGCVSFEVK